MRRWPARLTARASRSQPEDVKAIGPAAVAFSVISAILLAIDQLASGAGSGQITAGLSGFLLLGVVVGKPLLALQALAVVLWWPGFGQVTVLGPGLNAQNLAALAASMALLVKQGRALTSALGQQRVRTALSVYGGLLALTWISYFRVGTETLPNLTAGMLRNTVFALTAVVVLQRLSLAQTLQWLVVVFAPLAVGASVPAVAGLLAGQPPSQARSAMPLFDPNGLGTLCALLIVVLFASRPWRESNDARPFAAMNLVALCLLGISFACMFSRASSIALFLGLGIVAVLGRSMRAVKTTAIAVLAGLYFASGLSTRWQQATFEEQLAGEGSRFETWRMAWNAAVEAPVFGLGGRTYMAQNEMWYGYSLRAHNYYVEMFAVAGIVGLAALLGFYWYYVAAARRHSRAGPIQRKAAVAAYGIMAVLLTHNLAGSVLAEAAGFIPYLTLLAGLLGRSDAVRTRAVVPAMLRAAPERIVAGRSDFAGCACAQGRPGLAQVQTRLASRTPVSPLAVAGWPAVSGTERE